MTTIKVFFWICLVLCIYTYAGYGVILYLMVCLKRWLKGKSQTPELPADEKLPEVTLLICAFNEQEVIEEKMKNTNNLDYPSDKLQIMWGTDGSTDNTNE